LDDIGRLTDAWDAGRCAPVQHGLQAAVEARIADARTRITELTTLIADLEHAATMLAGHTPDGPCDDDCGCTSSPTGAPTGPREEIPIVCTLATDDVPARADDWERLLARVTTREAIDGGLRLQFDAGTPVDEIARLAVAENGCCSFFAFALTVDDRGHALEVRAPAAAQPVLHALFGDATAGAGGPR
jgi:hypothetical protein